MLLFSKVTRQIEKQENPDSFQCAPEPGRALILPESSGNVVKLEEGSIHIKKSIVKGIHNIMKKTTRSGVFRISPRKVHGMKSKNGMS